MTVNLTIYFWENLDNTMLEIQRVLKPNGIFINVLFSNETLSTFPHAKHGCKRFAVEELTNAGVSIGFDVKLVPIMNDMAYCILFHKA